MQAAERVGKSPKLTMKSRLAASRDDRFTPLRRRVKQAASENSERKVRVTLTLEETDRWYCKLWKFCTSLSLQLQVLEMMQDLNKENTTPEHPVTSSAAPRILLSSAQDVRHKQKVKVSGARIC